MNYHDFLCSVEADIKTKIPKQWNLNIRPFPKNNGVIYDGLVITRPNLNISPTVYLNPYYHRYLDGAPLEDIYQDILDTYYRFVPESSVDLDSLLNFEQVKDCIIMKLIHHDRNSSYLKEVPHLDYLDLAVVFQVYMGEDKNGFSSITVTDSLLERWNTDIEKLQALSMRNTPKLLPYKLMNLDDLMEENNLDMSLPKLEGSDTSMYILTNNAKVNGAVTILYENLLQDIAEDLGHDLILLPSSIHEFIIVTDPTGNGLSFYNDMVRQVNEVEVADYEVLSDHAYYYSLSKKKLFVK